MQKLIISKSYSIAKVLLLAFLWLYSSAANADDMMLQIWQADGQVVSINLNDEPRTTYNDGNLVITTTKVTITYPLENVKRYTYVSASNGISSPGVSKAKLSANGETLTFTGLKAGTSIILYNVAGQLLRRVTPSSEGYAIVSVSKLPTGVYIVKMNDATYKITKR